jgi:diguanylate cyclase (GGDEF)-like protein
MLGPVTSSDTEDVEERTALRHHVSRFFELHADEIVSDAVAVFPFAGVETAGGQSVNRLAGLILHLLRESVRSGSLDASSDAVGELRHAAGHARADASQLFGLVHLVERAALDGLALDDSFGSTSEPWPALAQMVRRSSFDVLAAYADGADVMPADRALVDPLTTVHTRAVLAAALEKEIQRAERFGHPFALILVDVDRLADINVRLGYGSGDRVLERLGIVLRNYFREHDWVARVGGNAFGVLLPETQREHAQLLAERVRGTVEGRMALHDYRSEEAVPVTVSVAVVFAGSVDPSVRAEQLLDEARQAMQRAKAAGRNRVESIALATPPRAVPPRDKSPLA